MGKKRKFLRDFKSRYTLSTYVSTYSSMLSGSQDLIISGKRLSSRSEGVGR